MFKVNSQTKHEFQVLFHTSQIVVGMFALFTCQYKSQCSINSNSI